MKPAKGFVRKYWALAPQEQSRSHTDSWKEEAKVRDYLKEIQKEGDSSTTHLAQAVQKRRKYENLKKEIWFEETNRKKWGAQRWHFPRLNTLQDEVFSLYYSFLFFLSFFLPSFLPFLPSRPSFLPFSPFLPSFNSLFPFANFSFYLLCA